MISKIVATLIVISGQGGNIASTYHQSWAACQAARAALPDGGYDKVELAAQKPEEASKHKISDLPPNVTLFVQKKDRRPVAWAFCVPQGNLSEDGLPSAPLQSVK
jgi:hypothetical protein